MQIPLQITFHGMAHSDAISDKIRQKVEKLERYRSDLMSCRVVLEVAGRHKHHGKQVVVRIDLTVPGSEIVVTHEHDEDLDVALREAFNTARRRLEDFTSTQRGDVKRHSLPGAGTS